MPQEDSSVYRSHCHSLTVSHYYIFFKRTPPKSDPRDLCNLRHFSDEEWWSENKNVKLTHNPTLKFMMLWWFDWQNWDRFLGPKDCVLGLICLGKEEIDEGEEEEKQTNRQNFYCRLDPGRISLNPSIYWMILYWTIFQLLLLPKQKVPAFREANGTVGKKRPYVQNVNFVF